MRLVVLAVLMTAATCQECQNPKEISVDFKPVFDYGDNWSFENCGLWSNREVAAPWRIAVSRTDGATCFGILLSNYDFVTLECKEVADYFRMERSGVKAYTGTCYDQKVKSTDTPPANCTGLEVVGVAAVGNDSDETQLHMWRLAVALSDTTPICLFNANQKQKGGYGDADYNVFDRKEVTAASVGGALRTLHTSTLCVKIDLDQFTKNADKRDFSGDFLVKEVRGRMTLRGFFFWPVAEKLFIYADVVPFIKELVANSYNMFLLPQVPPPKTKTDFTKAPTLNKNGECGIVKIAAPSTSSHIPGRHYEAVKGAHPWHASISYRPKERDADESLNVCGATLISNRVVITAAHCIFNKGIYQYNASDLEIALGMHNSSTADTGMEQFIRVERFVMHPEYNPNTKMYDVALLFLKEEANVTTHVRPICLWDDDYSLDILKGQSGTVVGWGFIEDEKTKRREQATVLQEGRLSVLDHKECYIQEKLFFRKYLKPGVTFCASEVDAGFLFGQGFGASSFAIQKDSKWYLRGVVSFSIIKLIRVDGDTIVAHNKDYPSLMVDLGSCMEWIVQQVAHFVPLAPTNQ